MRLLVRNAYIHKAISVYVFLKTLHCFIVGLERREFAFPRLQESGKTTLRNLMSDRENKNHTQKKQVGT